MSEKRVKKRARNSKGGPSRVSRTGRRQANLERELSAERRRALFRTPAASRLSGPTIAITRGEGELHRITDPRNPFRNDPRVPLGTRQGLILSRQTAHHGSRRHGTRHLNMLRRFGEHLNREEEKKRLRLANYRDPHMGEFNAGAAVEATPFNYPVNLETEHGHRPKREQHSLPQATRVGESALFERVRREGTEQNLFDTWTQHRPQLTSERNQFRRWMGNIKRRPPSPNEPRRPRSH